MAPKTQGMNRVELKCVHLSLLLLNSKNLLSQNKTDYTQLNQLHYLSIMWRQEILWRTINIQ
jgi:hypothetical protein